MFFSSFYQFYTLQAKLDAWVKEECVAPMEKRISAKDKILKCYHKKQMKLDLAFHDLRTLPDIFDLLPQLTVLCFCSNQFTELPESIDRLIELRELNLNQNKLAKLPECIGRLKQLTHLDLSFNQLTELPKFIGNLTQLTILGLGENRLTELPQSIGNLTQLEWLFLQNNRLTSLPPSFFTLGLQTTCYLENNRFSEVMIDRIRERVRNRFIVHVSVHEERRSPSQSFEDCIDQLKKTAQFSAQQTFPFSQDEQFYFLKFYNALQNSLVYKGSHRKPTAQFLLNCLIKL